MNENVSKGGENLPFGEKCGRSIRRVCSHELFEGQSRLLIEHNGIEYLLQITRQGKLILTK